MVITADQLQSIIGKTPDRTRIERITDALNLTFEKYQINTPLRVCHFLAQVIHESGSFRYMEEIWGPTEAQRQYEGRINLGNNVPGDGYKFRGRGYIQLTGRANYKEACGEFGKDFLANPDLVAQYPYVALIAGWYWKRRNINFLADKDDVIAVTKAINGGTNGLYDREIWLTKVKSIILK